MVSMMARTTNTAPVCFHLFASPIRLDSKKMKNKNSSTKKNSGSHALSPESNNMMPPKKPTMLIAMEIANAGIKLHNFFIIPPLKPIITGCVYKKIELKKYFAKKSRQKVILAASYIKALN